MKNERKTLVVKVPPEYVANNYVGQAMQLLQLACNVFEFCSNGCPLRNIETGKCMKEELQTFLKINAQ